MTQKPTALAKDLAQRCREAMGAGDTEHALTVIRTTRQQLSLPPCDPVADLVATLLAGGDVPDDLGEQLLEQERRHRAHLKVRDALDAAASQLHLERRHDLAQGADRALAILRDELDRVLADARGVFEALGDVDTADAAIDNGVADAWRIAQTLAREYRTVRDLQAVTTAAALDGRDLPPPAPSAVMPAASRRVRELVLTVGTVRDFERRYPGGYAPATPDAHGPRITEHAISTADDATASELPWATGDPVGNLRWTVEHAADVWLPSINDINAAEQRALEAREQLLAERHRKRQQQATQGTYAR